MQKIILAELNEEDFDNTINDMAIEIAGKNGRPDIVASTIAELSNESSINIEVENNRISVFYEYDTCQYSLPLDYIDMSKLIEEHLATLQVRVYNGSLEPIEMIDKLDVIRGELEYLLSVVDDHRITILNNG